MKRLWTIVSRTVSQFSEDGVMGLAAAIAFYSSLSVAPLILLGLSLAGRLGQAQSLQTSLLAQVREVVGQSGVEVVRTIIEEGEQPGVGFRALIGLGTLLFAGTTVFAQVQYSLNRVWGVRARPKKFGVLRFLRVRLLSLVLILLLWSVLLASLLISAGLALLLEHSPLPTADWMLRVGNVVGSLAVFTVLFASIFRLLPDVELAWRDVWLGALATAVLFVPGKEAAGLYLGRIGVGTAYGAAGSMIALLVWVYYASLILLLGAELTQVLVSVRGRTIRPARGAELVTWRFGPQPGAEEEARPRSQPRNGEQREAHDERRGRRGRV